MSLDGTSLNDLISLLCGYVQHQNICPLSQWQQGEPTADGGYRTMYAGKWYRGKEHPKCTCGLNEICDAIEKEAGIIL